MPALWSGCWSAVIVNWSGWSWIAASARSRAAIISRCRKSSDATVKYQGQPVSTIAGTKSGTNASVNFGAGVDLNLIITLYLEAKYTIIFTEGESSSFVPVSLGITF